MKFVVIFKIMTAVSRKEWNNISDFPLLLDAVTS